MFKIIVNVILLFLFIGCGGGNSSDRKTVNFTGYEIDGLTQVNNGDKVSFYVGDIFLAKVSNAHENMTLFDLAEVTAPIKALDVKRSLKEKSLNRVMNIASFLQTIDQDGDAKNGIKIPKALEVLTKDVYLDFNASPHIFSHSFALRKLMAEGRKRGIWEADRHIVKPYVALDTLYASLNLKPEIFVVKSEHYLYQLNDSTDSHIFFDAYGNAYLKRIDRSKNNKFDIEGRLQTVLEDSNNNSNTDFKTTYDYDKYGNKILRESYINKNVIIYFDNNHHIFYDYGDDNGELLKYKQSEHTYNLDGNLLLSQNKDMLYNIFFDTNLSYTYDKFGNRISSYKYLNKYEQYCSNFTFNTLGLIQLEENDDDCDSRIDRVRKYTYDTKNQEIERIDDIEADGIIDVNSSTFFYNNGTREQTFLSYNDGVIDSKQIDIYDTENYGKNKI